MRDPNCPWREFAGHKGCCDYCGGKIAKYRRNWCDDECAKSYAYNHGWALAKIVVWQRESRACCHCGLMVLRGVSDAWHADYPARPTNTGDRTMNYNLWRAWEQQVTSFYQAHKDELGEVDHVRPADSYNSGCQNHTDNLRLLCRRCHRTRHQWDDGSYIQPLVVPGVLEIGWALR